jgi:hypothetical protein
MIPLKVTGRLPESKAPRIQKQHSFTLDTDMRLVVSNLCCFTSHITCFVCSLSVQNGTLKNNYYPFLRRMLPHAFALPVSFLVCDSRVACHATLHTEVVVVLAGVWLVFEF